MSSVRKENAKKLAEGYSSTKRAGEIVFITTTVVFGLYNLIRIGRYYVHHPDVCSSAKYYGFAVAFGAILLADFISGVAHWVCDTWGTPDTPIIGVLIRSFREHHVDQMAITRHDIIETNGDNCMSIAPALVIMAFLPIHPSGVFGVVMHSFVLTLSIFIALTNQFHKWSHERKRHPIVQFLMSNNLILSHRAHKLHHKDEFDVGYCITTGWLNPPLDAINFWRVLEKVVTLTTGAIPRANDADLLGVPKSE